MAAMILKTFAAFMMLQMLSMASQMPDSCPVYSCPNGDRPIIFQKQTQPPPLFSRVDTEDRDQLIFSASEPRQPSRQLPRQSPTEPPRQPSSGFHMGPNEIAGSAELFSREILKVS